MPVHLSWEQVALRLALTVIAGLIIGINRGEHGRAAGMRTTLLVCLTASLSMILANRLLATSGKTSESFVQLDLMRLPLGILTGVGFIGAGTILRRGSMIVGVTTAATLWFVTMLGMCFGAGDITLGSAALAIGWAVLWGLKQVEKAMPEHQSATLDLSVVHRDLTDAQLRLVIEEARCKVKSWSVTYTPEARNIRCEIEWEKPYGQTHPPAFVAQLATNAAIDRLEWSPQGTSSSDSESES